MNKRILCIGDIHGGYLSLLQCLERSEFDYQHDTLICLGDVADGWPETPQCIEELLKIKNLIYVFGNHDCLSEDTDCLTNNGWKKYNEIKKTDMVLTLNTNTGLSEWQKINKIIVKPKIKRKMINIKNSHFDMLVTPKHRILHQRRKNKIWNDLEYRNASTINNSRIKISVSSTLNTKNKQQDVNINLWLLAAWALTDGHITKNGYVIIYQSKLSNIERIKKYYTNIGLNPKIRKKDIDVSNLYIKGVKVKSALPNYEFYFNAKESKIITDFIGEKNTFHLRLLTTNTNLAKMFMEEMILADGTTYKTGGRKNSAILYGTKNFLEWAQILCLGCNYRAVLTQDNRDDWRLNITKNTNSSELDITKEAKKEVDYIGEVWCLNVDNSNFLVRRSGKPFFTGNCWALDWLQTVKQPPMWTSQGGQATIDAYNNLPELKGKHKRFLEHAVDYYVDKNNNLFVHGGINPAHKLTNHKSDFLIWDRSLWKGAQISWFIQTNPFKNIFIGHTTTYVAHSNNIKASDIPINYENIWNLDQGGGYEGKLSIMDVATKEFWQSDKVNTLYPNHHRR